MTKILLVEDDKSLREIYGVRLLAEGYDIISAGDGEEALAMAIKDRPALIVSDVMMPKISGFDMLDILRSTTETRDIKVIMMTALSSEDQRKRGEDLGADRYLVKSQVGIEDVVRTVHEVLGDAAAQDASAAPTPTNAPSPTPPRDASVAIPSRDDATASAPAPDTQQAAQPQSQPPQAAPTAPTPTQAQSAEPAADVNPLPQPTAPFSTKRPAGLGDRIIQPLETTEDPFATSISDQMSQELDAHTVLSSQQGAQAPSTAVPSPTTVQSVPDTAVPTPLPAPAPPQAQPDPASGTPSTPPQAPQPQFDSVSTDEASITSHLEFEETPQTDTETSSSADPTQSETVQAPEQDKPAA